MIRNEIRQWPVASAKQSYEVPIKTPSDPTGTSPDFGVTLANDNDGPSAWTAGSWSGTWDTDTHYTTAVTPTIGVTGGSATLASLASGSTYWVWARVTLGGEVWAEPVGALVVP